MSMHCRPAAGGRLSPALLFLAVSVATPMGPTQEATVRVVMTSLRAERFPVEGGCGSRWAVPFVEAEAAFLELEAGVLLETRIEPCFSNPSACGGAENHRREGPDGPIFGCSDMLDNDRNGLTDAQDSDCRGTKAWSLSLVTEPCFNVSGATTRGTIADFATRPPGMRDVARNFEKTEVIDPALNGGRQGVVSAVVLSFTKTKPLILPRVGDTLVLRLEGAVGIASLPEGSQPSDPGTPVLPIRARLDFTEGLSASQ